MSPLLSSTSAPEQVRQKARNPLTEADLSIGPLSSRPVEPSEAKSLRHLFLVDFETAAYVFCLDSATETHEPLYVIPKGFKRGAARVLAIGKVTHDRKSAKCVYTVTKTPVAIPPLTITVEHRDSDAEPYAKNSLLTKRSLHKGMSLSFSTSTSSHKWKVDEHGVRNDAGEFIAEEVQSSQHDTFRGACELRLLRMINDDEMDFLVAIWVARIGNEMGALDGNVDPIGGNMYVKGEMVLFNYQ